MKLSEIMAEYQQPKIDKWTRAGIPPERIEQYLAMVRAMTDFNELLTEWGG